MSLRLFLACLLLLLSCPLPAQDTLREPDSVAVIRLLKEGKGLMDNNHTRVASAQYFGDAFRLALRANFYRGQGEALRYLGWLDALDKYKYSPTTIDYLKRSLEIWQEYHDGYEIAHTFIMLGDIFAENWKLLKEGISYYKQALVITKKMRKDSETQMLHRNLFKIHLSLDEIEEATFYSKPLIAHCEEQGFHEQIAQIRLDIAQYWAAHKEFEKAKKIAQTAQDDFKNSGGDAKQFEPYLNALKNNFEHSHTIDASRVSLMIFTVLVLAIILTWSFFYARVQVAKMAQRLAN